MSSPSRNRASRLSSSIYSILLLLIVLQQAESIYSPYYKRCRTKKERVDADAVPIQDLQIEIFPNYPEKHMSIPVIKPQLELDYIDYHYYFHEFIDSGGSGEVYLVQDISTSEGKIAKRYFKERERQFKRENYIMKKLNYPIQWSKYCKNTGKCQPHDIEFNTVSLFPQRQSMVFRVLQFDRQEAPLIFYKVLLQIDKIHRAGIIHNDIKMGNILVNSMGLNFKFYEMQMIDWNLAQFYYTGKDENRGRGTACFFSPEELLRSQYLTPARDIWSLGITLFTYYANQKPFTINCKKQNLKAIATLVGAEKLLDLNKKYKFNSFQLMKTLKDIENHKQKYPERDFYTLRLRENQSSYTKDLADVFKRMLEPDPEKRATAAQLLKMNYFSQLKKLPEMYFYKNLKKNKNEQVSPSKSYNRMTKQIKSIE